MKFKDWPRRMSDLMILAGVFLILCAAMFWLKSALAAQEVEDKPYLVSTVVGLAPPLPTFTATPTSTPIPTITPTLTPTPVPPTPTPVPSAGKVVRLDIPRISVNRAVKPVGLLGGQWNTDALFSNRNRQDLVGQLATSVNPGDGGNIILIGHNYNQGWNAWSGVFVNLGKLQPGDQIIVHTENGGQYTYIIQYVRRASWIKRNKAELEKHQKHMWPTDHEQLTLVTCSGANVVTWSHRIYVVALPVK